MLQCSYIMLLQCNMVARGFPNFHRRGRISASQYCEKSPQAGLVRVVIIEDASRFARDLMTKELGILSLIKLGVRVITATGDDLTDTSDPMKKAMRQIAGAFAELEKARLVSKLKGARERKRAKAESTTLDGRGKCEGRKSVVEARPEVIEAARALNDGRSLRKISAALAEQGYVTPAGKRASARRHIVVAVTYCTRQLQKTIL
jgi:DNA invertase Pin-like site-specific DNA recombinase